MSRSRLLHAATIMPALAGVGATGAAAAPASPEAIPPPTGNHLPAGLDVAEPYIPQVFCSPTAKPGVKDFAQLMARTYRQSNYGISRECGSGVTEHSEGRALDWMLDANDPQQRAIADSVVAWLTAPDADGNQGAMARRFGIMYLIWNRQIWGSYAMDAGWRPYNGPSAHSDHIHFSFSWDGAYGRTSWWTKRPLTTASTDSRDTSGRFGGSVPVSDDLQLSPLSSFEGQTLRRGSTGRAVVALQNALKVSLDGSFGDRTESALRDFQRRSSLAQTGVVDHATWLSLLSNPGPGQPGLATLRPFVGQVLKQGSHGVAVDALQTFLGVDADGEFGPLTAAALVRFQQVNSLPQTGQTDTATWASLVGPEKTAPESDGIGVGRYPGVMRSGSAGPGVAKVQKLLQVSEDGFGKETDQAVRAYQTRRALAVDGVVGPMTWSSLQLDEGNGRAVTGPLTAPKLQRAQRAQLKSFAGTPMSIGSHSTAVAALQRAFGLSASGWFDVPTAVLVRAFQASQQLTVDGLVGPQTWRALLDRPTTSGSSGGKGTQKPTKPQPSATASPQPSSASTTASSKPSAAAAKPPTSGPRRTETSAPATTSPAPQSTNAPISTAPAASSKRPRLQPTAPSTTLASPRTSDSSLSPAKPTRSVAPKQTGTPRQAVAPVATPTPSPVTSSQPRQGSEVAARDKQRPATPSPTPSRRAPQRRDASAAPGVPDASDTSMLQLGSTGSAVSGLQRLLGVGVDGEFGPQTDAAVRAFQVRAGIEVDGVAGPETMAALRSRGGGSGGNGSGGGSGSGGGAGGSDTSMLQLGSTGSAVSGLQRLLGVGVDGEFGPQTDAAVRAFQVRAGIEVDGVAGPETMAALRSRGGGSGGNGSGGGSGSGGGAGGSDTSMLQLGSTGSAVSGLQRLLGVGVDGEFGPQTDAAVRAFQVRAGIEVDGVAGPETMAALRSRGGGSGGNGSGGGSGSGGGGQANVRTIIATAKRYLGAPYVWGGSTPRGFDCSGFTQYVFAQSGISLPRVAEDQRQSLTRVYTPRAGDLVFFGAPAYHVGIYLGNGMMIDSPHTGAVVAIRPVYSSSATYGRPAGLSYRPSDFTGRAQVTTSGLAKGVQVEPAVYEPSAAPAKTATTASQPAQQTLRPGDSGPAVRRLQASLKIIGVDGTYGVATREAVIAFQRARGLPATGDADPQTRAALDAAAHRTSRVGQRVLKPGSRGATVEQLQRWLGITVDGIFGPRTEDAVKAFQASVHLTRTGIVAAPTWEAINRRLTA